MQKLLITGVDGMLGANLAAVLADRAEVVGLHSSKRPVQIPAVTTQTCDLDDPAAVEAAVVELAPHFVIHCGRCSQASWDVLLNQKAHVHADREAAIARAMADATIRLRSKLTVIATDSVFTGPRLFHEENETAAAPGSLADAARAMEDVLAATPTLIVRTTAYGWNLHGGSVGFAEQLWNQLAEGTATAIDPQPHATPILAADLAELLWHAQQRGLEGLYHITGAERTSMLRFATELAALAGFDAPSGAATALAPHDSSTVRAETSLNTRRARRLLKKPMPLLREGLERFVAQKRGEELGLERELLVAGGRAA
ncbi:MAG: sugar nucleotide-binding protein [Pirellulales bacterium]|nr:sugar nucleotide-binding protein [Pirellulales bacterium]